MKFLKIFSLIPVTSKIDINVLHVCVERSIFLANLHVGLCLTITLRISLHDLLCGWMAVSDSGCAGDCAIVAVFTARGGVQGKWMQIGSACCQQRHQVRLLQLPPPPRLSKNQGPALHTQYPQSKSKKSHKPKDIEPKEMIHKTSPEKSFQFNHSLNLSTAPLRRPLGKQPATGD